MKKTPENGGTEFFFIRDPDMNVIALHKPVSN